MSKYEKYISTLDFCRKHRKPGMLLKSKIDPTRIILVLEELKDPDFPELEYLGYFSCFVFKLNFKGNISDYELKNNYEKL